MTLLLAMVLLAVWMRSSLAIALIGSKIPALAAAYDLFQAIALLGDFLQG